MNFEVWLFIVIILCFVSLEFLVIGFFSLSRSFSAASPSGDFPIELYVYVFVRAVCQIETETDKIIAL